MTRHPLRHFFVWIALLWSLAVQAGSYEDFFAAIAADDAPAIANLLRRGFDANTRDPDGQHGLFLAIRGGSKTVTELLLNWPKTEVESLNKSDESPLMMAALRGELQWCKRLIERGAAVNKTGWAPLHYAATNGHLDVISLLLEHHAFIDAESPNKSTPLMMAARYGSAEATQLLLDEGAEPLLKNQLGMTAIDFANSAGRGKAAELISQAVRSRQPKGKW